jgi:hypothetical protein
MKITIWLIAVLITLNLLCPGCGAKPAGVTFNDLFSTPEKYSGKAVTVAGIYMRGWEWLILADAVAYIGTGNTRELKPVGDSIWFAGLMPKDVQDKLSQFTSHTGDTTYFGKLRVTGIFETEGKYGNMNAYKYQITASKVELMDWTPPK